MRKSFPTRTGSLLRKWIGLPDDGEMREVLAGVDIVVPKGKLVGILGQNGAGKSTLLRVLAGVYPPTSGEIDIDGEVASLFELGGVGSTQLSGRSFARGYLSLIGVQPDEIEDVIAEIREFSELERYFDEKISTYSSGMAARLYFAVATAIQREVYLIDEILAVGDEHFQVKSQLRMRERLLNGASGVLVTHDWASVVRLCSQASILADGLLSAPAASDQTIAKYLNLALPYSDRAHLAVQDHFLVQTDGPFSLSFDVVIQKEGGTEVAVSIDVLEAGVGWEPVVLTEFLPISDQIGRYSVTLELPFVPLRPGKYSLGIFLTAPLQDGSERTSLDVRSWTYGNGVPLVVEGVERADLAPFPVGWSQVVS